MRAPHVTRTEVARDLKSAIVYVKDLDDLPDDLPEDVPIFKREEDGAPTLDLDSLDALELGILFEEKYGLGIGSELELTESTTLADVIEFVVAFLERDSVAIDSQA